MSTFVTLVGLTGSVHDGSNLPQLKKAWTLGHKRKPSVLANVRSCQKRTSGVLHSFLGNRSRVAFIIRSAASIAAC